MLGFVCFLHGQTRFQGSEYGAELKGPQKFVHDGSIYEI